MGETVDNKTIEQYFMELSQRIGKLESGGKAFTATENPGVILDTLDPDEETGWITQVGFSNAATNLNPNSVIYFTVFIDGDGTDINDAWPYGANVVFSDHHFWWNHDNHFLIDDEPGAGNIIIYFKNLDSVPHDYRIEITHLYMSGQSGSGVEAV